MKKILLLAAAVLAAGCASQDKADSAARAEKSMPASEPAPAAQAAQADADAAPSLAVATVTGTLGCGHCTYETTTSCAAAVRTDDGVVWILEGIGEDSELFTDRYDAGVVEVTGSPREDAGKHYLAVESYERTPGGEG